MACCLLELPACSLQPHLVDRAKAPQVLGWAGAVLGLALPGSAPQGGGLPPAASKALPAQPHSAAALTIYHLASAKLGLCNHHHFKNDVRTLVLKRRILSINPGMIRY